MAIGALVRKVEVTCDIDHPFPGDLEVTITSPEGTVSRLTEIRGRVSADEPVQKGEVAVINTTVEDCKNGACIFLETFMGLEVNHIIVLFTPRKSNIAVM